MPRVLVIASLLGVVAVLVPACQGTVDQGGTGSSTSTQTTPGAGGSDVGPGCAAPCCEDDPQFPIQRGDGCVQCNTDSDCADLSFQSAFGLKCQPDGMCGCAVDSDCVGDAAYPRCRVADASCVQCLSDADCDGTCDTTSGTCVPCDAGTGCGVVDAGP
jgi:hypothetical protein